MLQKWTYVSQNVILTQSTHQCYGKFAETSSFSTQKVIGKWEIEALFLEENKMHKNRLPSKNPPNSGKSHCYSKMQLCKLLQLIIRITSSQKPIRAQTTSAAYAHTQHV